MRWDLMKYPQEYRQSRCLITCFYLIVCLKAKEKKRKGIITTRLLSCCIKLMELVKEKEKQIIGQAQRHVVVMRELNEKISDVRSYAITIG